MSFKIMTDNKETLTIGWYGKIPSLGDFISRRIPASFIEIWDSWLQKGMATSRAQLGEHWLDLYLTSPMWRFILMPDTCSNSQVWTGVLMPSVDKIGRHFPLTIATQIEPHPRTLISLISAQHWYAAIEQIALASLDLNISPDDLDQSLTYHPLPKLYDESYLIDDQKLSEWWQTSSVIGDNSKSLSLPTSNAFIEIFEKINQDAFSKMGIGKSIWWKVDFETNQTQLHCFVGLPPENRFTTLLDDTTQ
ncbi:MAG TPA: type VI secretion system-associated protein TagF [Nitrosomonas sp.]|nr:type VI secretion system-associated protein TagF [Nitrosomonas sp.]HRB20531.1 type VI secretion system-associated protein TagF [Nitrosomonas sp.]HRB32792.1 type VI secretion system-associated protein TagF [Nitrosomonas sp.]HRB77532.1 type VI secretion system-associated protein TagF [Nitrosomonas sp.]